MNQPGEGEQPENRIALAEFESIQERKNGASWSAGTHASNSLLHRTRGITTKVRSPRTNGFVERMNRTLLDECFRVHGRTTWYEGVDDIQADLDRFLLYYNLERSHQDYRLRGRTPAQALREALDLDELPPLWTTDNDHREGDDDHTEAA